jgi:hypothetical protein
MGLCQRHKGGDGGVVFAPAGIEAQSTRFVGEERMRSLGVGDCEHILGHDVLTYYWPEASDQRESGSEY